MSGANTWRGANTWSVALNENSQAGSGGGSSGVQSITAGTNITLTGTATNPIINSTATTGVASITAGAGVKVNQATGAVTVQNTGVITLTAGTNVSLTGTATDPVVNASFSGVQSVSAGTNTTITGTATNPIINLVPSQLPAGVSIDIANANYTVNVAQLANAYFFSSVVLTGARTIFFPNYASLVAQYGNNAVIPFTMGAFKQFAPGNFINIEVANDTTPNKCFTTSNVNTDGTWNGTAGSLPSQAGFVLAPFIYDGKVILDSDLGGNAPITNQKAYYTFNYRCQYIPST
jgi:hypothetical protein